MYQSGLVAVIKVGGKVLRESQEVTYLPFGSEYSVLVKNLQSKRVAIRMSIDGTDVFDNKQIIIPANSEVELERFIRDSNLNSGNKFKFIERTEAIEDHRGIKSDDGLIRIEYWAEKVHDPIVLVNNAWRHEFGTNYQNPWGLRSFDSMDNTCISRGLTGSVNYSVQYNETSCGVKSTGRRCHLLQCGRPETKNDAGITVAGGQSNQKFGTCAWFETETQSEVLILKLRGNTVTERVTKPITVRTKKVCVTCGKKSRGDVQFCPQCGTALDLI